MNIKDFAEQINFKKINNSYYYEKDGFIFYLKEYESFIKIKSFYVSVDEKINNDHLKEFTNAAFENVCYITSNESNNDTLIITLPTSLKVNEGFINSCTNIINSITKKLKELNYTPKTRCIYCHEKAEYNTLNEAYLPLHAKCKENIKNRYQEIVEKEEKAKYRYLLNIVYSLLICTCMFFINYCITYYFNVIITPLLLLITFGSFIGLHLSKVRNDKLSYFITFTISLNFIILFNILAFNHLSSIKELNFITYFNENTWYVIRKVLFSLLFIFGGHRLYQMFLAKKHPDFRYLLKNM